MKMREVIARGVLASLECPNSGHDKMIEGVDWEKVYEPPVGTKIELVSVTEPKRKLMQPDGLKWEDSLVWPTVMSLVLCGTEIAAVSTVTSSKPRWTIGPNGWKAVDNIQAAKDAIANYFADNSHHGFRWEPEVVEYKYHVLIRLEGHRQLEPCIFDTIRIYKWRKKNNLATILYGVTDKGGMVEVDRCGEVPGE
jgi:hypothetical protein